MNPEASPGRSQRLFIELGTALLLEPQGVDTSISSQLTGMQVGKYLIAQISPGDTAGYVFETDQIVHVKYILSNDVMGFKTRIIQILESPDYLIFMEYPQEVKSVNIRADKRMECFLPVRLEIRDQMLPGHVIDINTGGCGCLCHAPAWEAAQGVRGTPLNLHLAYGQFESLTLKGEVRSQRQDGSQVTLGILFDKLDGFSQKVISSLVPSLKI